MKKLSTIIALYRTQIFTFSKSALSQFYFQRKLPAQEQIFFIKRLSFLLKAGIPIVDSLLMIQSQTKSKKFSNVLENIVHNVINGKTLGYSLRKFSGMWNEFALHIIEFSENSGILTENLEYLAVEMKKRRQLTKKIVSACIYPFIITLATFSITGFLIMYLFPKITPVFKSLRIQLPVSTRIVITISDFIHNHSLIIICSLAIFVIIAVFCFKKFNIIREYTDMCILHTPVLSRVSRHYNLANSSRTLGILLQNGLTLSDATEVASQTASNHAYRKEFKQALVELDKGENISHYFEKNKKLFPHIFTYIIAVGEKSGNLSNSFLYLSELYEEEVDDFTKNLGTIIEPLLMIVMGILIGFIAISIITPIYSITQNLHA